MLSDASHPIRGGVDARPGDEGNGAVVPVKEDGRYGSVDDNNGAGTGAAAELEVRVPRGAEAGRLASPGHRIWHHIVEV